MSYTSIFPPLDIPKCNILSYLYPLNRVVSDGPVWIDTDDPRVSLSPRRALSWVRRLGHGLDYLGIRTGEVAMICTPNHIFVPVAYQGIVGSGRIFSGANPMYTQWRWSINCRILKRNCFLCIQVLWKRLLLPRATLDYQKTAFLCFLILPVRPLTASKIGAAWSAARRMQRIGNGTTWLPALLRWLHRSITPLARRVCIKGYTFRIAICRECGTDHVHA